MREELLTVKEVAYRMRVHYRTVWRWIAAGRIQVVRIAGQVRIPESALSPEK